MGSLKRTPNGGGACYLPLLGDKVAGPGVAPKPTRLGRPDPRKVFKTGFANGYFAENLFVRNGVRKSQMMDFESKSVIEEITLEQNAVGNESDQNGFAKEDFAFQSDYGHMIILSFP